jgi:hypothetical protein
LVCSSVPGTRRGRRDDFVLQGNTTTSVPSSSLEMSSLLLVLVLVLSFSADDDDAYRCIVGAAAARRDACRTEGILFDNKSLVNREAFSIISTCLS